jgi:hypothetical protein
MVIGSHGCGDKRAASVGISGQHQTKGKKASLQYIRGAYCDKPIVPRTDVRAKSCCKRLFNVRLNLSTIPIHWGWYAIVFNFFVPSSSHRSNIKWDKRFVPLSERRASGNPKNGSF